jgi:hypothetical protein
MATEAFNKYNIRFTSKLALNLKKKLVKCYIAGALYGVETWTLQKTDQIYLKNIEISCERRV